jgi:segregation and condensation protein B
VKEEGDLKRAVEALLFASGEPLETATIVAAVKRAHEERARPEGGEGSVDQQGSSVDEAAVEETIARLTADYAPGGRGIELARLAGGWAFRTNPQCSPVVSALFHLPDDVGRLSPAATEALAVIAYLQPVSRRQVSEVRGVNSDSCLQTLIDRELIQEAGRSSTSWALLYGTTKRFEIVFGLGSTADLPPLVEFQLGEGQQDELRRRLGVVISTE